MRSFAAPLLILATALSAAGCIDLEQEYTLNPDGSGKVVVRWAASPVIELHGEKPETRARTLLKAEIDNSEGVDAWKDVSCVPGKGGKLEFKGTAYFKDFSKLKLHNNGFKMMAVRASKDPAGNYVVEGVPGESGEPSKAMSEDEAKKELAEARANHEQTRRMLGILMNDLKVATRIRLPGKVGSATNFKKDGDFAIRISLDGPKLTQAMEDLMKDDDWMLRAIRAGGVQEVLGLDESFNAKVFGEKGPVRAITTGGLAASFDYEKEAGLARKAWEESARTLGAPAGPAAKGEGFTSLKVAGVEYAYELEREEGLFRPSAGVKISLVGKLPGAVLQANEGALKTAVADSGADLLPRDFDRGIRFPKLSEDRTTVAFDVKLLLPPDGAKGFKELSGVLTYTVGGKTKEVYLGFEELKVGAQGKDASITKIEDSSWEKGQQVMDVELKLSNDSIESLVVLDESGRSVNAKASGYFASGSQVTRTLTVKGKFPARGRIIAKLYDDLKSYEIPFKLQNLDLLGRPLK